MKKKVKKIKKLRCLCTLSSASCVNQDDCLCPLHFLSLDEWHKHLIKYYDKKVITYGK